MTEGDRHERDAQFSSTVPPMSGLTLTPKLIEAFSADMCSKGLSPDTVQIYQNNLNRLYNDLPEDKQIDAGTLEQWRIDLLEAGYAVRTVNLRVSSVNSFLEYCGRRDLQCGGTLELGVNIQPELTRNEYLRLLSTARHLGKEREYLLVKVFAATGLSISSLSGLTVEAVVESKVILRNDIVHIPGVLQSELLNYAKRNGILSGPVFRGSSGVPLSRTGITGLIQSLCREAQVPEEKANPRCLKKLYQTTRNSIFEQLSLLVEQAHDRLLETEQLAIGWDTESFSSTD